MEISSEVLQLIHWVNSSALFNFCSVPFLFNSIEEWNGTGMGTEQEWNGNGTGMEQERNGSGAGMEQNGTGLEQKWNKSKMDGSMNAQFMVPGLLYD